MAMVEDSVINCMTTYKNWYAVAKYILLEKVVNNETG